VASLRNDDIVEKDMHRRFILYRKTDSLPATKRLLYYCKTNDVPIIP